VQQYIKFAKELCGICNEETTAYWATVRYNDTFPEVHVLFTKISAYQQPQHQ